MALIGRELTNRIDDLMDLHIQRNRPRNEAMSRELVRINEEMELAKRDITDALLAMDARRGVYVNPATQDRHIAYHKPDTDKTVIG